MKLSHVLTLAAVLSGIFGLAFVFVPVQLLSYYGSTAGEPLELIGRFFGSALIGLAVMAWWARNAADSDARKALVLGFFVANSVGFIVALTGQLRGLVNTLGWSTVVIYLIMALGFAYFQFQKSP